MAQEVFMGMLQSWFRQTKSDWFTTSNGDSRPICCGDPTTISAKFPKLKISSKAEEAFVYNVETNCWTQTSLAYAILNGHEWPPELLKLPHVIRALEAAERRDEIVISKQRTPSANPKFPSLVGAKRLCSSPNKSIRAA